MAIKGLNFNIGNISSAKIKGGGLSNAAKFKPSILKLNTDQLRTNVGLIDDIGEMRQVMRLTYGDNVKFRSRRRPRGLMARLGLASDAAVGTKISDWIEAGFDTLESRALWARFGR